MKNRIVQALLTALLISSMIVSPVFATTLEDMQKNKDQAETEASSLQEQLTHTLDKIDTLEADLDKKQEEVEKAGDDLEEAAAKQTEQYESMKLRIKYMYEEGNSSLLETLFSSTSFTDLLNKAEYVAEVHSYDRDKLSEYEATTKQVETMKNDLQDEYEQMQTMQTELEGEKASLTATLEDKQSEIAQLDQSIQDAIAARQEAERKKLRRQQRLLRIHRRIRLRIIHSRVIIIRTAIVIQVIRIPIIIPATVEIIVPTIHRLITAVMCRHREETERQ